MVILCLKHFACRDAHRVLPGKIRGSRHVRPDCTEQSDGKVLSGHLMTLDTEVGHQPSWFNATDPSVLDYYIAACLRWIALYPKELTRPAFDISRYVHLHALALRLDTVSATVAVAAAEGLGPTPFSAPHYPNPAEGSAT